MGKNSVHIKLPFFYEDKHFEHEISLDDFQGICGPILDAAVAPIAEAMKQAGVRKKGLGMVLLAGGSSQLPGVRERVKKLTGVDPKTFHKNPMFVIAEGAALYHRRIMELPSNSLQERIMNEGLGIVVKDDGMTANLIMLPYNKKLPASFERDFPIDEGQDTVSIDLRSGNETDLGLTRALKARKLEIRKGARRVRVKVTVDLNRVIRLEAYDPDDRANALDIVIKGTSMVGDEILEQRKKLGISSEVSIDSEVGFSGGQLCVGIDIGTTTSEISYAGRGVKSEVRDFDNGGFTGIYPSVVSYYDEAGGYIVAEHFAGDMADTKDMEGKAFTSFKIANRDKPLGKIKGKNFYVRDATALLIEKLWSDFNSIHGQARQHNSAVVTVPSSFGPDECQDTVNSARIAGIQNVYLIDEPTAAFLCYQYLYPEIDETNKGKLLVFDYGGGTSDITILEMKRKEGIQEETYKKHVLFEVNASSGNLHCGGEYIDRAIADHMRDVFERENPGCSLENMHGALGRLKREAESVKIKLSKLAEAG